MRGRYVLGWAHDPDRPGERLELDVELDGEPLGRHVADGERRDLRNAGIGDGKHAFRVELPVVLEPGSAHTIVVRSVADGTAIPLASGYLADMTGDPEAVPLVLTVDGAGAGPAGEPDAEPEIAEPDPGPADGLEIEGLVAGGGVRPRALLGQAGWLFSFESRQQLARALGQRRAAPGLVAAQVEELRTRHERLASLGVDYLVVTVPDKIAVYSEHLPPGLTFARESRPAADLAAALRDEPVLETFSLLPVLLDARRHGRAFLRQGARMTWTGAYYAYRAIAKELAKRLSAVPPPGPLNLALGGLVENAELLPHRERVTLIARELVGVLPSNEETDAEPDLIRDGLEAMFVPLAPALARQLSEEATLLELAPGANLPTAVIIHDGSGERLVPFLAEHFARTVVEVADALPLALIEQERPLVVVEIIGESGAFFAT